MVRSEVGHILESDLDPRMPIGRHFRLHEATQSSLAVRLGIDNTPNPTQLQNIRWTASVLMDPCRDEFGPITPSSWLRVPELNERIPGSSKSSAHQLGFAVDWCPKITTDLLDVMAWLQQSGLPIDQCVYEFGEWIHIAGREGSPRGMFLMKFVGSQYLPFNVNDPRVRP
jgi:hypothetical protein